MSGWKPALGLLSLPWPSWYHRRPKSILSSTTEKKRWRWPKRFCSTTTDNSPTGALFTSRSSWRLPAFIASFNFCKEEQNCEISFLRGRAFCTFSGCLSSPQMMTKLQPPAALFADRLPRKLWNIGTNFYGILRPLLWIALFEASPYYQFPAKRQHSICGGGRFKPSLILN